MKRLIILSIAMLFAAKDFAQNIQSIAIGSAVPMASTKLKSTDGKEVSIKDVMGRKGVLVMFSCNTCPVVVKYQGRTLESLKAARQNGFGVILINSNEGGRSDGDSYTAMQRYAKEQSYGDIPYVVDENAAVADAFGAARTPESFLFNAKGELVYHGAIDDNMEASQAANKYLVNAITETVSGKTVTVTNTRSVGCGIKRKG
jgi:peroxiredoxin